MEARNPIPVAETPTDAPIAASAPPAGDAAKHQRIMLAAADIEIHAGDAKADQPPRVSLLAYNGGIMHVAGWGAVVIDLANLAIPAAFPLAADHDTTLAGIIGQGEGEIRNGRLYVEGRLSRKATATGAILTLNADGVALQASVGVQPTRTRFVSARHTAEVNGQTHKGPFILVSAGRLREVSIVGVGADEQTAVDIAANLEKTMTTHQQINRNDVTGTAGQPVDPEQVRQEERDRVKAVDAACAGNWGEQIQPRIDRIRAAGIRGTLTVDQVKDEVIANASGRKAPSPAVPPVPMMGATARRERSPEPADIFAAAILCHAGHEAVAEKSYSARTMESASVIGMRHMLDVCEAALRHEGRDIPHGRDAMVRAAMSTVSLPTALGDTAHRVLLRAYREAPATWRSFANVRSVSDFRAHSAVRPTWGGNMTEVPPQGELDHSDLSEGTSITYSANTFGRMITIDRRDLINDDLGLFDTAATNMGRKAARGVSDLVWSTILANGGSFFSGDNGNLLTGADASLGIVALGHAIGAMATQRDAEDNDLDIQPAVLAVPPELRADAIALLESEYVAATEGSPTGNSLREAVSLEVESRISNTGKFTNASESMWFLFASPADAAVVVAFLNGQDAPTVEYLGMNTDPKSLAASWRVYMDYGASLGDYRAAVRSDGE